MGRPSKYELLKEEGLLIRVEGWARDGLSDDQIAENIGIAPSTLYEWKNKFSEFSESLKKGKDLVDREVENALLKRALGYNYDEVHYEEGIEKKRITKEVQPDTTAQIFWLKNRKKDVWKDNKGLEHSGETTHNHKQQTDLSKLSVEELEQVESILSKATTDD